MKPKKPPPLFVREPSSEERASLEAALRSADAFPVRRAQVLLASARKERVSGIARSVGCSTQMERNVIHDFDARGVESLVRESTRPKTSQPVLDEVRREQLQHLMHQSPRAFGKAKSLWTLDVAAEVCFEQGITPERMSDETIRRALKRLGTSWKRAKRWITSPDPQYLRKKNAGTG
jgi:transposase